MPDGADQACQGIRNIVDHALGCPSKGARTLAVLFSLKAHCLSTLPIASSPSLIGALDRRCATVRV